MRATDSAADPTGPQSRTLVRMRRASALLASAAAIGGLVELAMLRHWHGIQVAPWVILGITALAGVRVAFGGSKRLAQVTGGLGLFGAAAGMWHHIDTNHTRGAEFLDTWDALSGAEQWWLAFNGTVGPAPEILALGQRLDAAAVAGMALIVAGVLVMNLLSKSSAH